MQIIGRVFHLIKFEQGVQTIYDCFIIVPKKPKIEKLERSEIWKKIIHILTVHFYSFVVEGGLESFASKLSMQNGILSGIFNIWPDQNVLKWTHVCFEFENNFWNESVLDRLESSTCIRPYCDYKC